MSAQQTQVVAVPASGQVGDIGFGFIQPQVDDKEPEIVTQSVTASGNTQGPLKSALKSPGGPTRAVMSPTFKEEEVLEKAEIFTDKEQEKDLRIKLRVRIAKIILRGVNFSCSLVVLSLLAATFQVFNMTKTIAPRNGLPPWSSKTPMWPQITLLAIACVSLIFAVFILWSNIRHGHRRAEKVAVYYTSFAVAFFIFNIVMWAIGAAILSGSMGSQGGQDMWGWACKDNRRRELFENEVPYGLVCRLQNWALICAIIEIVIELFIITIYAFVFYRFWSKRRLRKSMAVRDRARSDLYLAQLRSQTAPNTPGLTSPRSAAFMRSPRSPGFALYNKEFGSPMSAGPNDSPSSYGDDKPPPFSLQPVPRTRRGNSTTDSSPLSLKAEDNQLQSDVPNAPQPASGGRVLNFEAAPGEQQYETVPIPGAYNSTKPSG